MEVKGIQVLGEIRWIWHLALCDVLSSVVVCRSSSTPGFASDSWDGYSWDAILGWCRWFRFLSPRCRSHSYWILHLTQPCLWVAGPIFQPSYSWVACPCRWAGPIRVPCGPLGAALICPYWFWYPPVNYITILWDLYIYIPNHKFDFTMSHRDNHVDWCNIILRHLCELEAMAHIYFNGLPFLKMMMFHSFTGKLWKYTRGYWIDDDPWPGCRCCSTGCALQLGHPAAGKSGWNEPGVLAKNRWETSGYQRLSLEWNQQKSRYFWIELMTIKNGGHFNNKNSGSMW